MTEAAFIDLLQNALWLIILLSAPMLLVNLMVGVAISIFQAVTQIQEASLSFVPKLLASFLILILAGPWMTQMVLDYSNRIFDTLVTVAKTPKQ
ncbi:flagellar biosynthesis protein FliQ [Vampirovibrio chlorellavorus]|uniref:flagellar biosynthesis protein FliQ n=1 Tax=Vampirovibrio chlorellavorus TaxID=758823 RepID=UPI0026F314DE|nr:flagellar biosynthesis protein FliQ [Vampirovibrio chlorellavorus]